MELEVARIPLQDQVAMVRRAGCALWRHTKVQSCVVVTSVKAVVLSALITHSGMCYGAEICTILLLLRCPF